MQAAMPRDSTIESAEEEPGCSTSQTNVRYTRTGKHGWKGACGKAALQGGLGETMKQAAMGSTPTPAQFGACSSPDSTPW